MTTTLKATHGDLERLAAFLGDLNDLREKHGLQLYFDDGRIETSDEEERTLGILNYEGAPGCREYTVSI